MTNWSKTETGVNGTGNPFYEVEAEVPYNPEDLDALGIFPGQAPDPFSMMTDSEWEEFAERNCILQDSGPFIEGQPNTQASEPVVAETPADQSDFFDPFGTGTEPNPTSENAGPLVVEPDSHQEVWSEGETKLENFSSLPDLDDALRRTEWVHVETSREDRDYVRKARAAVILAIEQAFRSRYNLGKALSAYKDFFKSERGWMVAANIIAGCLHKCERTVRNAITDYEKLSAALPAEVIDAAESRGIDLARRKFLPAVKSVQGTIKPNNVVTEEQASEIVNQIIAHKTAGKTAKLLKPVPSIEGFADRTATSFEKLLRGASPEARETEVRFVLEFLNHNLGTSIMDLRQYDRQAMVPRPPTAQGESNSSWEVI